jgi:hypothetical protein
MKLVFRIILSFLLSGGIVVVVWINLNLSPVDRVTTESIVKQLNFLSRELQDGADAKMQDVYPEGYVFMNSLYALAWCDVLEHTKDEGLHREGSREMNRALSRIQSEEGKAVFDADLPIPYGAFYTGWSTYVLGRKLDVIGSADEEDLALFRHNCDSIASIIQRQIYPEAIGMMPGPPTAWFAFRPWHSTTGSFHRNTLQYDESGLTG